MPADTRVRWVRMRSWPGRTTGQGISATSVSPVLRLWRICFMGFVHSDAIFLKISWRQYSDESDESIEKEA